jgi:hypothetical protein
MSEQKQLVPVEQKQVLFYEDEITAVLLVAGGSSGLVYAPVKQLCEHMGVAWAPQYRRIQRDEVLSEAATSISVTVTEAGQRGAVVCACHSNSYWVSYLASTLLESSRN